jgi:hypothetical protein
MSAPSLTPMEDAVRATIAAAPAPADPMQDSITRVVNAFSIEAAQMMDAGCQPELLVMLSDSVASSVIDSTASNLMMNRLVPAGVTRMQIVDAILANVRETIVQNEPYRTDVARDDGPAPGRA